MDNNVQSDIEPNDTTSTARVAYILYLLGLVTGVLGIIGVILAYINKDDAPDWLRSHYRFLIRTFWIGFLYLAISFLLMVVLIGYLGIFVWMLWLIIRCIKGLKALDQRRPVMNESSWGF
ncbi:DUF4870 family protein [Alteromonas oceanisediminis]|uniref:DUF4870 family protein n=1 Tax=Alteromonas oceanisediminis TaxID=2836180 RepID=UPI001BDB6B7E|nr:DUF4870 domain-containing protein [Alteromonas oceanisediminis]MBT0587475.1 hypothetical protein [Alteromonas oceanisediminis]